jgi:hypothetical protein
MIGRNQEAVQKTSTGLLKLIYPHRSPEDIEPDELMCCVPDKWPFGVDYVLDVTKGVMTREVA